MKALVTRGAVLAAAMGYAPGTSVREGVRRFVKRYEELHGAKSAQVRS